MEQLFTAVLYWAAGGSAMALMLAIGPEDQGFLLLVGLPWLGLFLLLAVTTLLGLVGMLLAWDRR